MCAMATVALSLPLSPLPRACRVFLDKARAALEAVREARDIVVAIKGPQLISKGFLRLSAGPRDMDAASDLTDVHCANRPVAVRAP
jgi:hypothetical protein